MSFEPANATKTLPHYRELYVSEQKKPLRITFVCGAERPSGGQRVISLYADHLSRRGHDVTVVIPCHRSPTLKQRVQALFKEGRIFGINNNRAHSFLRDSSFRVLRLNHFGPVTDRDVPDSDVVIASWWEVAEWVAELHTSKGVKVHFIQGHEAYDYLPIDRVSATYRLPLHKIVISQWLKRLILERYGDQIIDLVPNSVDRTQFFAPPRGKQPTPSVGFLYSASYTKGADAALLALHRVRNKIPDLRILSFGISPPNTALPLLAATEYFCSPPQDQIRTIYSRCDAWLSAGRSEGFNLTALEAMACRTPVISTRTGWPADAVKTNLNGVLVDVDDVEGLSAGLEWVVSRTDEDWRFLSANAYGTASIGSWEDSVQQFESALRHACARAQRGELLGTFK